MKACSSQCGKDIYDAMFRAPRIFQNVQYTKVVLENFNVRSPHDEFTRLCAWCKNELTGSAGIQSYSSQFKSPRDNGVEIWQGRFIPVLLMSEGKTVPVYIRPRRYDSQTRCGEVIVRTCSICGESLIDVLQMTDNPFSEVTIIQKR